MEFISEDFLFIVDICTISRPNRFKLSNKINLIRTQKIIMNQYRHAIVTMTTEEVYS